MARDANIRKAKVGENLIRGEHRQHACFLGEDGKLACIKPNSQVEIAMLRLVDSNVYSDTRGNAAQPQPNNFFRPVPNSLIKAWDGKENVRGTFIRWQDHHRGYAADAIKLEDGIIVHIAWIAKDVTISLPRKVRKDKGVERPHRHKRDLVKVLGLDQVKPVTDEVMA